MAINLANKIKFDTVRAMKDGGRLRLSVMRLLVAELEKEKVSLKLADVGDLTDEQTQAVVSRQIKKLDKEIEAYVAVGRETDSQEYEKEVLKKYLPEQATEEEIRKLAYHADSLVRRGEIRNPMQYLGQRLRGKADMKLVAKIAKEVQQELDDAGE